TISCYSSTVKDFICFCDLEDIPNQLQLLADEFVLCTFAASSVGKHAGNTARGQISAIQTWHTIYNVIWKGSAPLQYVLNGVDHLAPAPSKKQLCMPTNAIILIQLINALDLRDPLDATIVHQY
ncbi:hypothetical protein BYT27DRAFT_7095095, partial [Phlegmacium glaucopus]